MLQLVHSIQSHVTTSTWYPITCYNQCKVSNHMLQPVHSIQSHVTTSAWYPITCYNQCTISNHMLQPVYSIKSHVLRCTLTYEDLWSPQMCLFLLQTSTTYQLTAVADTHTEHSQLPHVHVNSHTCRNTMLYYTVLPLYTRRLILKGNTVLRFYTSKIISDILVKAHKSYFITQD